MAVVRTLCDEMAATRQLTAPGERLDEVSPAYLELLAAEGVVTRAGRRYGFGHETLLDYCSARVFFNRRESLVSSLEGSEQHLFRRTRIRQTLAYLRDADPALYVRELSGLLAGKRIRGPSQGSRLRAPRRRRGSDRAGVVDLGAMDRTGAEGHRSRRREPGPAVGPRVAAVLRVARLVRFRGPARRGRGLARLGTTTGSPPPP